MSCVNPYLSPTGAAPTRERRAFCRKRRVKEWMFRMMQEEKNSSHAIFVTLTYDTENVPISSTGHMTLRKTDIQKWMKRYRKAHPKGWPKIRYYLVGEYGPKTNRPHYHAIVFDGDPELVASTWKKGDVHIGDLTGASASYCAGYISKPGPKIPLGDWDKREKQFSLMSKGLGFNYLTPAVEKWHKADLSRNYVVKDGFKLPMPRYYRKKIDYTDEQRIEMQEIAAQKYAENETKQFREHQEKYPLKSYSEWKRERIEHFRQNEQFFKRKL